MTKKRSMKNHDAVLRLNRFLFAEPKVDDSALFTNCAALGRILFAFPDINKKYKNPQSCYVALHQFIEGKRPFIAIVKKALELAIQQRLIALTDDAQSEYIAQLRLLISSLEEARRIYNDPLFPVTEKTGYEVIFVVYSGVPEARQTKNGRQMLRYFLTLFGVDLSSPTIGAAREISYTLCLPAKGEAIDFWRGVLEESLRDENGDLLVQDRSAMYERLQSVAERFKSSEDEGYLSLLVLPKHACLIPVCLYHYPDKADEAFIILYENEQFLRVRLPTPAVERIMALEQDIANNSVPGVRKISISSYHKELIDRILEDVALPVMSI